MYPKKKIAVYSNNQIKTTNSIKANDVRRSKSNTLISTTACMINQYESKQNVTFSEIILFTVFGRTFVPRANVVCVYAVFFFFLIRLNHHMELVWFSSIQHLNWTIFAHQLFHYFIRLSVVHRTTSTKWLSDKLNCINQIKPMNLNFKQIYEIFHIVVN